MFQPCLSWETETLANFLFTRVYLHLLVPRPAFEIIKVGKMRVKRKAQKNTVIQLYFKHLQLD